MAQVHCEKALVTFCGMTEGIGASFLTHTNGNPWTDRGLDGETDMEVEKII